MREPAHWHDATLGSLGEWRSGGTPSKARADYWTGEIPWVSPKDMKVFSLRDAQDHISERALADGARSASPGSVFIVVRGMILAHTFPVCVAERMMAFNQDIKAIVPNGSADGRFVAHWLAGRSDVLLRLVTEATHGTKRIELTDLLSYSLSLPPLPEQRRIADILDTIDEAIRKTEEIIVKLEQVKHGLLHDLHTRGIDDNGELRDPDRHPDQFKPSPLGRIPKAWEVGSLGAVLDGIDAGKSPSCPDRPAHGDEWGVLKVSAVRPAGFQAHENKAIVNPALFNPEHEVRDGDLLISRANTYDLVGLTCLVEQPPPRLLLCDKTLRLRSSATVSRQYLFYTTQMPYVRTQIETRATGSSGSMKNIGQDAIRALQLRLPSRDEQQRIADTLRARDLRARREEIHRGKLSRVKQGLMDDLLTGRVRVTSLLEVAAE